MSTIRGPSVSFNVQTTTRQDNLPKVTIRDAFGPVHGVVVKTGELSHGSTNADGMIYIDPDARKITVLSYNLAPVDIEIPSQLASLDITIQGPSLEGTELSENARATATHSGSDGGTQVTPVEQRVINSLTKS